MWLMGWLMSVGTDACMRVQKMLQGSAAPCAARGRRGRARAAAATCRIDTVHTQHICFLIGARS
jgi:hypothetical protein